MNLALRNLLFLVALLLVSIYLLYLFVPYLKSVTGVGTLFRDISANHIMQLTNGNEAPRPRKLFIT